MNRKEEILARCIDEVRSGRSTVEDCLARHPELSSELKPLLEIAFGIRPPKAVPSPEFRSQLRSRLIEEMGPAKVAEGRKEVSHGWFISVLSFRAVAILLLAFIVLATGAGSVYAAQDSLPGEVLYPVKVGVEKLQIAVTVNPEDRAYLHLKLAQRRIDEVASLVSLNRRLDVSGLATLPAQTDAALHEIEKISPDAAGAFLSRLAESTIQQQIVLGSVLAVNPESGRDTMQQAMNTAQRANLIAEAAYSNPAFLNTRPSVQDESLDKGRFKVDGTLLSVAGRTWNVGGLILSNVRYSGEIPVVNNRIKIDGLNKNNEVFIIKLEREENVREEVKIEGVFKGTDKNGKTWFVGDMPVDVSEGKVPPAQGERLELQGVATHNTSLTITDVKKETKEERENEHEAKLEGKLISVDAANRVITVKVAGAKVSCNIGSARIHTKDGKEVNLSELASLVGKEVKAVGLVKKDGVIYARDVRIDVEKLDKEKFSH